MIIIKKVVNIEKYVQWSSRLLFLGRVESNKLKMQIPKTGNWQLSGTSLSSNVAKVTCSLAVPITCWPIGAHVASHTQISPFPYTWTLTLDFARSRKGVGRPNTKGARGSAVFHQHLNASQLGSWLAATKCKASVLLRGEKWNWS